MDIWRILVPILPILAIILLASFIRSTIGFGDALLATPILMSLLGVQEASALAAMFGMSLSIILLLRNWRTVDFRLARNLIVGGALGVPLGLLLIKAVPAPTAKAFLGWFLIVFGCYSLFSPKLPYLQDGRWGYGFGFIGGVLGSAYGTGGPPLVVFGTLRRWPPDEFRSTLQSFFFVNNIFILTSHALAGFWTSHVLMLYTWSIPMVLIGTFIGLWASSFIPKHLFRQIICIVLIMLGIGSVL